MKILTTLLEVAGFALIVAGVALISWVIGLIVAGVLLTAFGVAREWA